MIKNCPICKSRAVIIIGKVFRCKKCGFLNRPINNLTTRKLH